MTCKAPTPPPKQVTEKKALLVLRALSQEEKDYIARVAPNLVITIDQVKKDPQLQKILDKALAQGAVTMTPPPSSTQTQQR